MFHLKVKVIQQMAKGEKVSFESSGLSKREWNELMTSFDFTRKDCLFFSNFFKQFRNLVIRVRMS